MSQNYIATQKIKGKKINFQNLQTRNDKSQIDFRRINSINNLQTNYNYIKEYLKSRQNKDTKQAKEFSLGTIKIAQNITKGAVNLKKKILTIKTNAEPIEQMKKEAIQKKIEPPNYRPSFTYTFSQTNKPSNDRYKKDSANNNIKKENNKDLIDLINMCSSSSDYGKKKRNSNKNNHSYFISNNNKNGHNNSNNNNNANKNNINKKNGKNNHNGNNNNKNSNNDKNSSSLASEISKDFKKIDFKYLTDNFKASCDELFKNISNNIVDKLVNSFKEFQESQKLRDAETEKKNRDLIYEMMALKRYENHLFILELKDLFKQQNEENMSKLFNFVLTSNDKGKKNEE